MCLLETATFELQSGEQSVFRDEGYAILSYRWIGHEISPSQLSGHIAELKTGEKPMSTPQLEKIRRSCALARGQGIKCMWINSCCINNTSTVEETASINSMFRWYRDAKVCITYLSDVKKEPHSTSDTAPITPVANVFKRTD